MLVLRRMALVVLLLAVASRSPAQVVRYENASDGVAAEVDGGTLRLTACSARAVRVVFTPNGGPRPAPSLAVVHPCDGFRDVTVRETPTAVSVLTARLEARLDRRTAAVSFHDPAGGIVLR